MTMSSVRRPTETAETPFSPVKLHELICELNGHVAQLREHLIIVGSTRDSPEVRERIRRTRLDCINATRQAFNMLMPQIRKDAESGVLVDSQCLVLLFSCTQLLCRELTKSGRLIAVIPMDMTHYYENGPGPSNSGLGNVISQMIRHVPIAPSFHREELLSISKDCTEVEQLLADMQEFMPKSGSARDTDWKSQGSLVTGKSRWKRGRSSCCCYGVSPVL